jgi:hypothetical protein
MYTHAFLAVFAAAALTSPAAAADGGTDKPAKPKQDKICVREDATGSIMPRMVCHTKAEWAQINQERAKDVDRMEHSRSRQGG